jgi:hypothetical protein
LDPVAPTYDRCCRWIVDTFERAGSTINHQGIRTPSGSGKWTATAVRRAVSRLAA